MQITTRQTKKIRPLGAQLSLRKEIEKSTKPVAFLSAFDKTGLDRFANQLVELGWDLLASAGTAKYLAEKGIKARDVAEIVGPPILRHRVVTLSREIHAALLATNSQEDQAELDRLGIQRIDLVYVNLYPLVEEILKSNSTLGSVIEKTDIGGPTLLRSAAKGRRIVLCSCFQFDPVLKYISGEYKGSHDMFISGLVSIAEIVVSKYCESSAIYHRKVAGESFQSNFGVVSP